MKRAHMGDTSPQQDLEGRKRPSVSGEDALGEELAQDDNMGEDGGAKTEGARAPRAEGDMSCAVKVLVAAQVAGCLIGKGGSTIVDLQERTGARIKLSQNTDFYPGTQDRIVMITGDSQSVTHAVSLIVEHLHSNTVSRAAAMGGAVPGMPVEAPNTTSVKILIPRAAGGLVIGKGGTTIKMLNEESGARIQLAAKEDAGGALTGERIVTVSGALDNVLKGLSRLLEKLNEEPELTKYTNFTTSYSRATSAAHPMHPAYDIPTYQTQSFAETQLFSPGSAGAMTPRDGFRQGMAGQHMQPGLAAQASMQQAAMGYPPNAVTTFQLQVPDKLIGAILGKGGVTLRELQEQSGSRIRISKRDEFAPGTTNRIVTLEGTPFSIEAARNMVNLKVSQASQGGAATQQAGHYGHAASGEVPQQSWG